MHLPYRFRAAENAVFLPIMLVCPPVQSFYNSTVNFRDHASATFLVNDDKRPLLKGYFLNCLETSSFRWRQFCRCVINKLGHAFSQTQNVFTNGALILKISSVCSFTDTMFSSGNFRETFFFCFMYFVHTQSISESKSAYFCLLRLHTASKSGFGKFLP